MIELTNRTKSPISVVIRSKKRPRDFTTLTIPGIGSNHNTRVIEDERMTEYVDRLIKSKLISKKDIK